MTSDDQAADPVAAPAAGADHAADLPDGGDAVAEAPAGGELRTGRHLPGPSQLARAGYLEYDRILFFSDAVFAIAITLLAIDLRVPVGSSFQAGHQLRRELPGIYSFALSFAVIGLFWLGHHSTFRHITAFDRPLIMLNLLFLGTIAFLPYPTEILGGTSTTQAPAVIFYAACCGAAGLVESAAWWYATRPGSGLAAPGIARVRLPYLLQAVRAPVIFLLSIPVAVAAPTVATFLWILILPAGVIARRRFPAGGMEETIG